MKLLGVDIPHLKAIKLTTAQWIWAGAAAALALFLVFMAWPRAQAVDTAVIDRGEVRREIVDEGQTRIHDVFVIAAPVAGELQRIGLEPGDEVTRGQVVAAIHPADPALLDVRIAAEARANVAAAESAVTAADAELDLARRDQERISRLASEGFASRAALDSANAALRAARANAAARRSDLQRARVAAGLGGARAHASTDVRSPAAGHVLRLLQQSQTVVGAGAPLLEIGNPRDLEIVAEFLSQDAVLLHAGGQAFIEGWGGDAPIPARIFRIEPYAHTKVSALGVEEQRVNVIVHLENPDAAPPLGHGFRVDVRAVVSEQQGVLRVPADALVRNGAEWAVFKIDRGRARLTPVQLGDGGEAYRAVENGLNAGDTVVLFPGDALRDGARVRARR